MFVVSKRVFVNVLVQYMTTNDLMKATYYVADVSAPNRNVNFDKEVKYYPDGRFEIINKPYIPESSISRFNIIYSTGWLDPTWAINQTASVSIGLGYSKHSSETPEEVYIKRLKEPATIVGVRDWLYGTKMSPIRHRGMRIIVINDEEIARKFGHIMCSYLAEFFGEDITFLDVKYRPQFVKGNVTYVGNKEFSKKMLHDLADYDMMMAITGLISQMGFDESVNNLTCFLETIEPQQLFYIYEKLFPYEPLPAGNYTKEQIITILVGKCSEKLGVVYNVDRRSSSLSTINQYLDSLDAELGAYND